MKKKCFGGGARPANISICCINMPIISRALVGREGVKGHRYMRPKYPATADRRHCRTPPGDLVIPSHLHTEPSGQETPDHQSPRHKSAVGRAMRDPRQSRRTRRPHGDRAMPRERSQQSHRCRHRRTPWLGLGSDGQRAASSGSPRLPGRRRRHQFVRTTAGLGHGTGRRTLWLDRRGTVGSGRGAAGAGLRTGLAGAPQSSWPRWTVRIRANFALRLRRCRSRLRPFGLLAGGRQCRER